MECAGDFIESSTRAPAVHFGVESVFQADFTDGRLAIAENTKGARGTAPPPAEAAPFRSIGFPFQSETAVGIKPELPLKKAQSEESQILVVVSRRRTKQSCLRL